MKDNTRLYDILLALAGLLLLLPVFIAIAFWIKINSKGPVLYLQLRVGEEDKDFILCKFRTMHTDADKISPLTVGSSDHRITGAGTVLRKYKLDELPQLWNVLKGEMSLVGPRPELRKYVALYNVQQKETLRIKPGITDTASIHFCNESELLAGVPEPEQFYIQYILPVKLELNKNYIVHKSPSLYFKIILNTIYSVCNPDNSWQPTEKS